MQFTLSALLPHPPIIVPQVGGARLEQCRATVKACRRVAELMMEDPPDRLVLVSPHAPRRPLAFGVLSGPRHEGDLSRFGAPEARVSLPQDQELVDRWIADGRRNEPGRLWSVPKYPLDHGAVVPLFFLAEAGWQGPTVLLSLPGGHASPSLLWQMGETLRDVARDLPGKTTWIASGDMSHRCLPGAPAGFHPKATEFDRELTRLIGRGHYREIADIDPELRELAAEDTVESAMVVHGATDFSARGSEVLSYEHPFGVGYLVAVFSRSGGVH